MKTSVIADVQKTVDTAGSYLAAKFPTKASMFGHLAMRIDDYRLGIDSRLLLHRDLVVWRATSLR